MCAAIIHVPAEHGYHRLQCDQPEGHDGPHRNDLVDEITWEA